MSMYGSPKECRHPDCDIVDEMHNRITALEAQLAEFKGKWRNAEDANIKAMEQIHKHKQRIAELKQELKEIKEWREIAVPEIMNLQSDLKSAKDRDTYWKNLDENAMARSAKLQAELVKTRDRMAKLEEFARCFEVHHQAILKDGSCQVSEYSYVWHRYQDEIRSMVMTEGGGK